MGKVSRRKLKRERFERRFVPASTMDYRIVYVVGGLGAIGLGAGFYGQWGYSLGSTPLTEPVAYSMWILAAGALILGAAIWIGTSGEAILRIGSAGIGEEKSGLVRRIVWHELEGVRYENGAVVVNGKDEGHLDYTIRVKLVNAPQAAAWIVAQARERVPDVVDISKSERAEIGEASKKGGESVEPPPLQVVGKRCAVSDKIIAYEPDARVCQRCERVYHRSHVPNECECGNSIGHMRAKDAPPEEAPSAEEESA